MASMNVSLSAQMKAWVEAQIASGKYHNVSEYVRDLIRRDVEAQERLRAQRAHLAEGAADIAAGRFETLRNDDDIHAVFDTIRKGG
jgi:antitoxin ParD1/3/4